MWYTCYYLPGPVNNAHTRIKNGLITVRTVSASVMCVCVISTRGKCKSRETKKRRNKRINCWFYLFSCFLFWMVPSVLDTVHSYKKCSQRIAEFCFFFLILCVCFFFNPCLHSEQRHQNQVSFQFWQTPTLCYTMGTRFWFSTSVECNPNETHDHIHQTQWINLLQRQGKDSPVF